MNAKEHLALKRIAMYCERAAAARATHFSSREAFDEDSFYADGVAMYIQQVGECVNDLSEDFQVKYDEVPWHKIRGMRNIIAHAYEGVDPDIVWEVLTVELPVLRAKVESILSSEQGQDSEDAGV